MVKEKIKTQKGFIQIPLLIAIIVGILAVGGGGYFGVKQYQKIQSDKAEKANQTQKLTEALKKEVENLKNSTVASTPEPLQAKTKEQATQQDPIIKIEKCKTQAKDYADKIATRDYLLAFEKAQAAGDAQTAQIYMEASFKPEHPANYDSNYNSEYIKCLDN